MGDIAVEVAKYAGAIVAGGGAIALFLKVWRWLDRQDERLEVVGQILDALAVRGITLPRWLQELDAGVAGVAEMSTKVDQHGARIAGHDRELEQLGGRVTRLAHEIVRGNDRLDDLENTMTDHIEGDRHR